VHQGNFFAVQTISFNQVFRAVLREAEYDPDTIRDADCGWNQSRCNRVADHIAEKLRVAWEWAMWPFLMQCSFIQVEKEMVQGKPVMDPNTTPPVQALDPVTGEPVFENLGEVFYVPACPEGHKAIGHVVKISNQHPKLSKSPGCLKFERKGGRFCLSPLCPTCVWVEHRPAAPLFTCDTVAENSGPYAPGDLLMHSDGYVYCYTGPGTTTITPGASGSGWVKQEIPRQFYDYIRIAAAGEIHRDSGLDEKADRYSDRAMAELRRVYDVDYLQQCETTFAKRSA